MARLVFRKLHTWDVPGPDELFVSPAPDALERAMARTVLEGGLGAFRRGSAVIHTVVVPLDPTLDDMIAAELLILLLAGVGLPPTVLTLARYVALVREGLRPGELPLERTPEGIYLAMRTEVGDLAVDGGARFLARWRPLASALLGAAQRGLDPAHTGIVDGPEFTRERTFLRGDVDIYQQDVLRGERFVVDVPGHAGPGSFLLLQDPKSALFKYWARAPAAVVAGGPHVLLGVHRDDRQWTFTTDPVSRLPIRGLAEALQRAEMQKNAARAAADPWFDGAAFSHTLVAAPKTGTALTHAEVLEVLRGWCHARPARTSGGRGWKLALTGVVALSAMAAAFVLIRLANAALVKAPVVEKLAVDPAPVLDASLSTKPAPSQDDAGAPGAPALDGMALIPRGRFWMGRPPDNIGSPKGKVDATEPPQTRVTVEEFRLDITEVSVDAYTKCVGSGVCTAPVHLDDDDCNFAKADRGNHPINCVTSEQAETYCKLQGKRLPTEQEWEYAARGGERGQKYSFLGDTELKDQLCWKKNSTCPVRSSPAGAFGLFDMTGNVWEWTSSGFGARGADKVVRGGSWASKDARSYLGWFRQKAPQEPSSGIGFRCARR